MNDEVIKALIEGVTSVFAIAITAGFFAYVVYKCESDGNSDG